MKLRELMLVVLCIVVLVCVFGCASQPPAEVVIGSAPSAPPVHVPVIKPCLASTDVKDIPPTAIPPRGSSFESQGVGVYADVLTLRAFAQQQRELLQQCAAASSPAPSK